MLFLFKSGITGWNNEFCTIGIVVGARGGNAIGVWVISCVVDNGTDCGTGRDWTL